MPQPINQPCCGSTVSLGACYGRSVPSKVEASPSSSNGDLTRRASDSRNAPPLSFFDESPLSSVGGWEPSHVRFTEEVQVFEYEQQEDVEDQNYYIMSCNGGDDEGADDYECEELDYALMVFAPRDRAFIPCIPNRREEALRELRQPNVDR